MDRSQTAATSGGIHGIPSRRRTRSIRPVLVVPGRSFRPLIEECLRNWSRHNAPRMGAALAFYALLSLMPLLLVVISVAGLIYGPKAAQSGVLGQIQLVIGQQRAVIVQALLEGAQNKAAGLAATVFGSLTLLFGATGVLTELRSDLNIIWGVPTAELTTLQEIVEFLRERLRSVVLVVGIAFLLTMSLALSTWVSALGARASVLPAHEAVLHIITSILSFSVVTALFGAIYKIVPKVPIKWEDVILGASVTSLLFTLGNVVLSLYLGRATFASTYGTAASAVVFAMWVYYSSQVFFLGAEFTKAFATRYGSAPKAGDGRNSQ